MINEKIIDVLKDYNISQRDGIPYLVCLFYGYEPSYIPDELKAKVHRTGIVNSDDSKTIDWKIPLFEGQETEFQWVKDEYLDIFSVYNKKTDKNSCVKRMKSLFSKHPSIRKEDILRATRNYVDMCISENRLSQHVKNPKYFIEQGKGLEKEYMVLSFIEEADDQTAGKSNYTTMN